MGAPSETQVREYLRAHPVAGFGEAQQIVRLPSPDDEQRYLLSAGNARVVLKRYAPAAVDRARREATGLKMGSRVGLAPELLLFDGAGGPLGGPVVAFAPPAGAPLGGARMSDADVQNWVFLLLALHHLPPAQVDVPSGMSPDLATWWQRMQPPYQACRVAYTSKTTGPLLKALTQLYAVVGARVEARKALWRDVTRRPCHGNAVAEHVVSDGGRLALVEWGDFGLGDPALEVGRAAGLSLLTGELSTTQYTNFIGSYLRGAGDLGGQDHRRTHPALHLGTAAGVRLRRLAGRNSPRHVARRAHSPLGPGRSRARPDRRGAQSEHWRPADTAGAAAVRRR